jgi:Protein of unknown function (DUF1553)
VNHIWLRHFGQALVGSVYDFGLRGQRPTHPELLDWLAVEFMERGWSMKAIHRLIVTSSTYRMQTAGGVPGNDAVDPENRYLWRMSLRRMESEVVRDSILAVTGELDRTLGGPELDEWLAQTLPRRSLYFRHTPEEQTEFLKIFDAPNPNECYRRDESVVPQQALALANSPLSFAQARRLARRLAADRTGRNSDEFIAAAFEIVLGRPPTAVEFGECRRFLSEQASLLRSGRLTPFDANVRRDPQRPLPDETSDGEITRGGNTVVDLLKEWQIGALRGRCLALEGEEYRIESNTSVTFTVQGTFKHLATGVYPYRITECGPRVLAREAEAEVAGVPPSADPDLRAREVLVHALFNHNEFVTIR